MAVLRLIVRTMKKRIVMKKKSGMRKMLVVMLLTLVSAVGFAKSGENAVRQEKLLELISEYSEKKNFNVIRISSFGASAIKGVLRAASAFDGDKDLKDTLEVIKGIRGGVIVKYGDCSEAVRRGFDRRLGELLENTGRTFPRLTLFSLRKTTNGSKAIRFTTSRDASWKQEKSWRMRHISSMRTGRIVERIPWEN